MTQSNHSILGEGLRLYNDTMRRLVKQRLVAAFPNNWWEDGVLTAVYGDQRSELSKKARNDPGRDKADLLEPVHFVSLVTRHFDRAFADVFHDYRKTQSLLRQVWIARNDWAHLTSGDMVADDVGHALYAIVQVLRIVQSPATGEVEKLRNEVMRIPEPAPPDPVMPQLSTSVKTRIGRKETVWREVIDNDFIPARGRGEREVIVVSGDVHKRLGWKNRNPSVCNALSDRRGELARLASVELIEVAGPNPGATTTFIYRLL